jgi:hypothetical protein
MKRGWLLLWVWVAVAFLLWIPHHRVCRNHRPQAAWDRAAFGPSEFVSTWCKALWAANPAFTRSRVGPRLECSTPHSEFLITDGVGLPWLDYRGPPDADACSQRLVISCKAAGQAGSESNRKGTIPTKFRASRRRIQNFGFFNRL